MALAYTIARNRPVGFFTFAINHLWQPNGVWGYHAVNLAIHLAAGLILFDLARRTLARPPLANRYGQSAAGLALAIASYGCCTLCKRNRYLRLSATRIADGHALPGDAVCLRAGSAVARPMGLGMRYRSPVAAWAWAPRK